MTVPEKQPPIAKYIETDPRRGPAEARLIDSGVPVWIVVDHYRLAAGDIDRVAADYELPREAVEAALAYFEGHEHAIDARIKAHHAAFAA